MNDYIENTTIQTTLANLSNNILDVSKRLELIVFMIYAYSMAELQLQIKLKQVCHSKPFRINELRILTRAQSQALKKKTISNAYIIIVTMD